MKFKKELKIGIFVVVVLVTSFFVINYLRGKDIFNNEIEVVACFEDIEGLAVSSPVMIKGYKAGKVSSVEYIPSQGNFEVICSILKDFSIPEDSRMTICSMDIMGAKGIKIDLGVSENVIADGGVIASASEPGLFDGLASEITPVLEKVSNTLDSLTVTVSSVNSLLCKSNQERIMNTLAHLEKTMKNVSEIAAGIKGKSDELDLFVSNLVDLSAKLNEVVEKVDGTMTGVSETVDEIAQSDIKGVVASFHALLSNINDPDGSIGKLLADGSVYDSLETLLTDIDTLVKKIQENPRKYMKISIF